MKERFFCYSHKCWFGSYCRKCAARIVEHVQADYSWDDTWAYIDNIGEIK